jgi:hypothetical protein
MQRAVELFAVIQFTLMGLSHVVHTPLILLVFSLGAGIAIGRCPRRSD